MKVLILFTSIGRGHISAAEALKSIILSGNSNNNVRTLDSLKYVNTLLNKTISEAYTKMARTVPKMFGTIYKESNKENKFKNLVFFLNQIFSKKILPLIKDFNPDIIVSTHMFPTEMVSYLKSRKKIKVPLVCTITDYAPHKTWIAKDVDAYIVASKDMIPKMLQLGVNRNKVYPLGIPVASTFFEKGNKEKALTQIGLKLNIPTILIMAGSFGVKNIFPIYTNLMNSEVNFQTILITGKNKKVYDDIFKFMELKKDVIDNVRRTKLIYFTNEVYKFMQAADLIITKPGGLTVSEALASSLPIVIIDAIPGPEVENADFLVKNHMGIRISKNKNCLTEIEKLLKDEKQLRTMKNSCKVYSQSMSSKSIYSLIKKLAKKY